VDTGWQNATFNAGQHVVVEFYLGWQRVS
jgi:hypothetical protein